MVGSNKVGDWNVPAFLSLHLFVHKCHLRWFAGVPMEKGIHFICSADPAREYLHPLIPPSLAVTSLSFFFTSTSIF